MSEREEQPLSESERAVRDAVRALTRPSADAAFSARLRHEFVSGRIGRRAGLPRPRPWFTRGWLLAPLATGFLAVVLLAANRGPDWRVVSANGEGHVVVNDVTFTPADAAGIAAGLRRGGHVSVQGAVTLDLAAPGVTALALAPGAELTLSASPNRWWQRAMNVQLTTGDAYFSTGRAFRGAHLDVHTPDATVRAVGTSFAVLCTTHYTCVCVMEGHVNVGGRADLPGKGVEIPNGMRRVVHPDQAAETLPILDDSVQHLHHQLSSAGSVLQR